MPFSQITQISRITQIIARRNPNSLLDVGRGMGMYGFLARTYLENEELFKIDGAEPRQKTKDEWRVRIDGIEGCEGYFTPVHHYAYNNLMVGDALQVLPGIQDRSYGMVIAVDILEHFTMEDGRIFLEHLKRVAKRTVLVSTPKEFVAQEVELNPYENHRSLWTQSDLEASGFDKIHQNPVSWIAEYTVNKSG